MKIGLFGGSFNPIHNGHIEMAKYALKKLRLDEIIFIPCYQSTDKAVDSYESVFHRINMMRLVLPPKCSISNYEVNQQKPIESIETIKYFWSIFHEAEIYFLIGEDNLETIDTWQDYQQIPDFVHLVVFRRKSQKEPLDKKGLKLRVMDNELWQVSSTEIRQKTKLKNLDYRVEIYARENKLYDFVG